MYIYYICIYVIYMYIYNICVYINIYIYVQYVPQYERKVIYSNDCNRRWSVIYTTKCYGSSKNDSPRSLMKNKINAEIILGIKQACANLQKHEARGMAQSIANCLQWPVNIISQGKYCEAIGDDLMPALQNVEFTLSTLASQEQSTIFK